jgi:hypothetical protein
MVAQDESNDDPASAAEVSFSDLMRRLGRTGWNISLVVTGGGSGAIGQCFRRPGASKNFVEAVVPYSHAAVADYLDGPTTGGHADLSTAVQIAAVAFRRATNLGTGDRHHAAGIALVAALPTAPPRDHVDRIHVVMHTEKDRQTWSRELTDRRYSRDAAETIADAMIHAAIESLLGNR